MSDKKEETTRRPYEKPALRTIKLAAEEVLSTGCKAADFSPAAGGNGCGQFSPCSSIKGS